MWQRPFYHEGMSELQDRFDGRRVAEAIERHRKHYEFWYDEKQMIETSPFFFIGTSWNDYIDCNIKSGDPGFVKVVGPNIIEYPEYDGNSMYRTLGNLSRNPNVGLLFVRFDGKSRRIAELDEQTTAPDFWNVADKAQTVLREQARLKSAVDGFEAQRKAAEEHAAQIIADATDEMRRLHAVRDDMHGQLTVLHGRLGSALDASRTRTPEEPRPRPTPQ